MPASRNDMYVLSTDLGFLHRVRVALIAAAVNINAEVRTVPVNFPAWSVKAYYDSRAKLASIVALDLDHQAALFTNAVATDANVIADATQGGTVVLTTANVAAQAALVTDAHLDSSVAGLFNNFIAQT